MTIGLNVSGEIRVNEQLVLTCMHTLMAREHNRLAHALSQINPHWDDETLYQVIPNTAKAIVRQRWHVYVLYNFSCFLHSVALLRLLQEARRIVIAEIQHITFNEFLPIILGKEVMEKFGLLTQKEVK